MRKREFFKKLRKCGYKIEVDNLDFRKRYPELYYNSPPVLLRIRKENICIELIVAGEICVYTDRLYFRCKGGKPDTNVKNGKLTYYLRKHGEWEESNWFEVHVYRNGEEVYEPYICHTLNNACTYILDVIREFDYF